MKYIILSIYTCHSTLPLVEREKIIADVASELLAKCFPTTEQTAQVTHTPNTRSSYCQIL